MPAILPAGQSAAAARYAAVRARTEALATPLTAEDCALQSMPDASPVKWHLGHSAWFFETFVLERALEEVLAYRASVDERMARLHCKGCARSSLTSRSPM